MGRLLKSFKQDDLFLIFIGVGLIVAYVASHFFNLSPLTGAFIVGAIIPQTDFTEDFGRRFNLIKDVFATLFFTGIGVSINPFKLGPVLGVALLVLIVALVSRFVGTMIGGRIMRNEPRVVLGAAIGLGIRGELSLIIAQNGIALAVVDENFLKIAFLVLIGSIVISIPVFNLWSRKLLAPTNEEDH
jgi:Kef-type K+ transport system membrane component KefB